MTEDSNVLKDGLTAEMSKIVSLGQTRLEELAERFDQVVDGPLSSALLENELANVVEDRDLVKIMHKHLLGMAMYGRERNLDASVVLDHIEKRCVVGGWEDTELQNWKLVRLLLERIIRSESIVSTEKAVSLSTDYENLLQSTGILVDIRPVFDSDRAKVSAAIVSGTLRVSYLNSGGSLREINIAVNRKDLVSLGESCTLALEKMQIAKDHMVEGAGVPVTMNGDD